MNNKNILLKGSILLLFFFYAHIVTGQKVYCIEAVTETDSVFYEIEGYIQYSEKYLNIYHGDDVYNFEIVASTLNGSCVYGVLYENELYFLYCNSHLAIVDDK